jgi:hypothetical protein
MTPIHQAHPDSINSRFADNLAQNKEEIINEWLDRVRKDSTIPTETLDTVALKNHMPQLFDDLLKTLRFYGSKEVAEQSVKDAEGHGATRWRQGCDIIAILREIKHLRAVFIYHLRVFEELHDNFGLSERFFISSTLHGFLDDLAIHAGQQFLSERMEWKLSQ